MRCWKVAGALHKPNGMTLNSSFFVTNTIGDAQRLFDGEMIPFSMIMESLRADKSETRSLGLILATICCYLLVRRFPVCRMELEKS